MLFVLYKTLWSLFDARAGWRVSYGTLVPSPFASCSVYTVSLGGGSYFEARNGAYLKHSLSGLPFLSSDPGRNRIQGKQV